MTKDIQASILRACARFIAKKVDPVEKRIAEMEQRHALVITQKDAVIESLQKRLEAVEKIAPQRGEPGKDAEPVTDDQILKQVAKYLAEHPPAPGRQGEPGDKGEPGNDAAPIAVQDVVRELISSEELMSLVELRVKEEVARLPVAKDGEPGRKGDIGDKGDPGDKGDKGDKGDDGVGIAGALIDRNGDLIITTSKGQAITLGKVIGRDGADFTEISFDYDGERTFTIKGNGAELVKRVPIPLDRGYWRPGMACEKSDIVTEGGNAWIALRDTKVKPGVDAKEDWRLFARKGRDGRDGHNGIDKTAAVRIKGPKE